MKDIRRKYNPWRDAFHMCLISLSPRHMHTTTTHVSWAQAYKTHVGSVSPRCGIEQIHETKVKKHEPKRTIPAN